MSPEAEPFSIGPARAERGALLLHGFTGSPFEMRLLGEHLAARGFAVEGPALAGHGVGGRAGTRILSRSRWPDWVASAERSLEKLTARTSRIGVAGLSMGGLCTAELARRRREVNAIALLSTALWLPPQAEAAARAIAKLPLVRSAALPKLAGSDIRDQEMKKRNRAAQGDAWMPLPALASLVEFGVHTRMHLKEVTQPALIAHGRQDHTVPFDCFDAVCARIGTPIQNQRRLILDRSFHVITLDVEREKVFAAVAEHFEKHL